MAVAVARVIVMNAVNEDLNPHRELGAVVNPLTPTVAIWVQLQSILCQTGLSRTPFVIFDILSL